MELKGKKWENYSTPFIDKNKNSEFWKDYPDELKLHTTSVYELLTYLQMMAGHEDLNHGSISEKPVFIEYNGHIYCIDDYTIGTSYNTIKLDDSNKMVFTAPDSKPEVGEYWSSRGPGYDLAGFVKSKKAGERIQRMVSYILDKDKTESHLDFREYEPNWIQYKFSPKEFDMEKLDKMSRNNGGVITEQMLRECIKEA